ncbi:MAG TPA: hypothetical protein VN041_04105 [Microbacterium sp.]|nr:hypothetical protein [Microbacterium sp.]
MTIENTNVSRRTLVKGAAWSLPVVAVAAATPLAAASTTNASLAWTGTNTGLLQLQLLDGTGVLGAQVAITVPDEYTITNGAGAITAENATVTITVGRPSGIPISVGRARGFGVASVDGIATTSGERTTTYQTVPVVGTEFGFPITTWSGTRSVTVASNGTVAVPVVFGLAGQSDLLSITALASFPVNLTVAFADGSSYTASSAISVPVGAGVL